MRIYIIGNDGITLCREAPATVNDGEVAVASKDELHAAPLSGAACNSSFDATAIAVIDGGRGLAAQRDSVIADDVDAHGWVLLMTRQRLPPVTHTDALFANQSQSILDNLVALLGQSSA